MSTLSESLVYDRKPGAAYNADDLNRVESAVAELAALFNNLPDTLQTYLQSLIEYYGITDYVEQVIGDTGAYASVAYETPVTAETKKNWAVHDLPRKSDMERFLRNLETVAAPLSSGGAGMIPESMDRLTCETANNIERLLSQIYAAEAAYRQQRYLEIANTAAGWADAFGRWRDSWNYCGETECGEL